MLIKWTQSAENDLTDALIWLIKQGEADAAENIANRLFSATERLKTFPHSGRPGILMGTRELILPDLPYFLIYKVSKNTIEIIRVIHSSRLWLKN